MHVCLIAVLDSSTIVTRIMNDFVCTFDLCVWQEENLGVGDYVGYALFGSLALLPYSGAQGLTKGWSNEDRWVFHIVFTSWWSIVALGAICKKYRHGFPVFCARFADLVGMIGITALVILYSQSILAPTAAHSSNAILSIAIAVQICSWVWVRFSILVYCVLFYYILLNCICLHSFK